VVAILSSHLAGIRLTLGNVLNAAVIVLVAVVVAKLLGVALSRVADRYARHRFRVMVLIPLLQIAVYGVAAYFVLAFLFRLSFLQFVTVAGLFGVALGLGVKDLVADVVGGLVLVAERPFQVGDKVAIGDHYGEVVAIGLRSTRLLTPTHTLAVLPNFTVFNEAVRNTNTSDTEMMVAIEFSVDPETDLARAVDILEDAMVTSPYVYVAEDAPYTVEVEDELNHRLLRGKAYVSELRNEYAFKTDVTTRVLETFDEEGIRSPGGPAVLDE
jgi:small-conductance mechanosensitive channel